MEYTPANTPDGSEYLRHAPEAWTQLVGFAESVVDPDLPYEEQATAANAILEYAFESLDDEQSEEALYYGFGLISCEVAQELADPERRQAFVAASVERMVNLHRVYVRRGAIDGVRADAGLYADEVILTSTALAQPNLEPAVRQRYAERSPITERLVANALMVGRRDRNERVRPFTGVEQRGQQIRQVLQNDPAVIHVLRGTFEGASALFDQCLLARTAQLGLDPTQVPLQELFSTDELPDLVSDHVARVGAAMRRDQINNLLPAIAQTSAEGALVLDPRRVPRPAGPVPNASGCADVLLHEKTLRCPAREVRRLVPFASRLLAEIVAETQNRLLPIEALA